MAYSGNYGNYGNNSYGGNNDYSTTSYGAQGGAGGGGFMSGSQPQGSQGGGGGSKYGKESLRPITILQCMTAPDPGADLDFRIDNVEVGHVHIVGQIRSVAKQATNTTYMLDDGTGTVDVKVWVDAERQTVDDAGNELPASAGEQGLEVGRWARCFGKIKQFNNKRHIGSNTIRAVKDMNEISMHLLEATAIHLYFMRGPPGGAAGGAAKGEEDDSLFVQQQGGGGGGGAGGPNLSGLSGTAKKVVEFMRTAPENNEGYNANHISAALRLPIQEIMKAGDELLQNSITYTTMDDNTWSLLE